MTKEEKKLIETYRMAAENAFGWAKQRRDEHPYVSDTPYTKADAERWYQEYMGLVPSTMALAQRPGSPLYLIGLAFADMSRTADEWDAWGYRLTAAHDHLCANFERRQQERT